MDFAAELGVLKLQPLLKAEHFGWNLITFNTVGWYEFLMSWFSSHYGRVFEIRKFSYLDMACPRRTRPMFFKCNIHRHLFFLWWIKGFDYLIIMLVLRHNAHFWIYPFKIHSSFHFEIIYCFTHASLQPAPSMTF